MLIGQHSAVVSDKRRVAVPRRFLDQTGNDLIIVKWYEECLVLVSSDFWDRLFERLTGSAKVKTYAIRDNERFLLGSAFEVSPDDQGRIVIPETLAEYAGFQKEVVFVGLVDRIEIWSKENWDKKNIDLPNLAQKFLEKIKND